MVTLLDTPPKPSGALGIARFRANPSRTRRGVNYTDLVENPEARRARRRGYPTRFAAACATQAPMPATMNDETMPTASMVVTPFAVGWA
jgi:hypothetical protein